MPTGAPGDSLYHPESDAGDGAGDATTIDTPESCPECGSADAEYLPHEIGCPSGYPTREDATR
jgi:hypothetical protein